jgi:integrase/recombinase XerD
MSEAFSRTLSLYSARGRKYLNRSERQCALAAMARLPTDHALYARTLGWSGARPSEILELTALSFQVEESVIAIVSLKRRRFIVREIPIPPDLMRELDRHYGLRARQARPAEAQARIWPWSRVTAWRVIKRGMKAADIQGVKASPRGLRHGFGVGTLQSGIPVTTLQKWLGHSSITSTAIYANACGPEDQALASRYWRYAKAASKDSTMRAPAD